MTAAAATITITLRPGESVTTASGRRSAPVPRFSIDTDRKVSASLRRYAAWALEQARAEVAHRGGPYASWHESLLAGITIGNHTSLDIAQCEAMLFHPGYPWEPGAGEDDSTLEVVIEAIS